MRTSHKTANLTTVKKGLSDAKGRGDLKLGSLSSLLRPMYTSPETNQPEYQKSASEMDPLSIPEVRILLLTYHEEALLPLFWPCTTHLH